MENKSPSNYTPLIALIAVTALAGLAVTWHDMGGMVEWMHNFMGFFLCCFALLKIFNLNHFANGFQMYDIVAKHSRAYARLYPFIELTLGLGYLAFAIPFWVYTVTILVMGVGTVGVLIALKNNLKISCPCMGTVLSVPLSTVTLTEDIGMGVMAAYMLFSLMQSS